MRRHLLLALWILMIPSIANAQTSDDLVQEGTAAYLSGDFSTCVLKFIAAYDIDPQPVVQYNISLCYGKLGNHEKALEAAKVADRGELEGKVLPKNKARMISFRTIIEAKEVATDVRADNEGNETCEDDSECGGGEYCATDGVCRLQSVGSGPKTTKKRFGAVGYVGVGLLAVGAGSMIAALLVDAGLASDLERLEQDNLTPSERSELEEDVESRQGQGRILVFAGAGFAVVGLGLLIYDLATVEEVPVAIAPMIGPDRVGASMKWTF